MEHMSFQNKWDNFSSAATKRDLGSCTFRKLPPEKTPLGSCPLRTKPLGKYIILLTSDETVYCQPATVVSSLAAVEFLYQQQVQTCSLFIVIDL